MKSKMLIWAYRLAVATSILASAAIIMAMTLGYFAAMAN